YIGEQYISSENCFKNTIVVNNQKKVIDEPIPIIAIYLLGHNLDNIKQAIIKSKIDFVDYQNKPIKGYQTESFIKGLIHNLIIVQIKRLPEKPKTKLEEILSVFKQDNPKTDNNKQLLDILDYDNNSDEYKTIVNCLVKAISNKSVRKHMELEDTLRREIELNEETNKLNFAEGLEKGEKIGLEKGEKIGIEKERAKAHQEKIEMAKKMKTMNMTIEQIYNVTGLTKDEIKKI
ncbi:MAG: hypothetical protein MJ211_12330, partial [Bacteroidales bacterium]|nr:hypothetical protein [Bacteroidales bacterium]